jgi:hypothetical protein
MLRHGADAMANAILDGCAAAVRGCMRAGSSAAARVAAVASVTRIASTATLRPMPARAFSARAFSRVSSHA